jgi:hypothetical protein
MTPWEDETNWLVDVVFVDASGDDDAVTLDYIGRLTAFGLVTNTRSLAQIGSTDPDYPAYELWFSFDSEEHKQQFLELVRKDGHADPDEEGSFDLPASLTDLRNLRPITEVFPKAQAERISTATIITSICLGIDAGNSDA